ncbi:glycosyltransferase [Patescibacteria group bacterium]
MRKILYIITKSNFGGAQKYVYDLATKLPKDKFEAVVAAGGDEAQAEPLSLANDVASLAPQSTNLIDKLKEAKIKTISIPRLVRDVSIIDDIFVFFFLLDLLRTEQPDIIHINSSKIGGIGALAGRIYNLEENARIFFRKYFVAIFSSEINILPVPKTTKIIFTAHGWAFNEPRSFLSRKIIKFLSWLTVVLSHKTIAVSDFDLNGMVNIPFVREKIVRIYNGVGEIEFMERALARAELLGEKAVSLGSTTWVGTIAELTNNKGLEHSIRAINDLVHDVAVPQFTYVIIGDGEDKDKLLKLIGSLDLGHVVFIRSRSQDAATLLKAFDIFLLPSLKEGLPYTLLEAGLAKLPSIATEVGGIPEIITHDVSGILIKPEKSTDITHAIKTLSGNKELANHYGSALDLHVNRKFAVQKMIDSTMEIYI